MTHRRITLRREAIRHLAEIQIVTGRAPATQIETCSLCPGDGCVPPYR